MSDILGIAIHLSNQNKLIGHEPDMVYLSKGGGFVDHDFLKAKCLRSILQHVSPLAVGALRCNIRLLTFPVKNKI